MSGARARSSRRTACARAPAIHSLAVAGPVLSVRPLRDISWATLSRGTASRSAARAAASRRALANGKCTDNCSTKGESGASVADGRVAASSPLAGMACATPVSLPRGGLVVASLADEGAGIVERGAERAEGCNVFGVRWGQARPAHSSNAASRPWPRCASRARSKVVGAGAGAGGGAGVIAQAATARQDTTTLGRQGLACARRFTVRPSRAGGDAARPSRQRPDGKRGQLPWKMADADRPSRRRSHVLACTHRP